jgi:hypothetical protein
MAQTSSTLLWLVEKRCPEINVFLKQMGLFMKQKDMFLKQWPSLLKHPLPWLVNLKQANGDAVLVGFSQE